MIYIVEEIHHVGVGIGHHTLIIIRQHVYQQIFDHILGIGRLEFHVHAKTDMQTGNAAGMDTVGVLWGFRDRVELEENHAKRIVNSPSEISVILEQENLRSACDVRRR